MAGSARRLIAFFTRAEPRGAPPTGWALALDAAVAVGSAAGAVYEVMTHNLVKLSVISPELVPGPAGDYILVPLRKVGAGLLTSPVSSPHAAAGVLVAAAMTALPLAARRLYPISVWLAIAAAIVIMHRGYVPPVALGTAVYAAYSAVTHSRYRNLAVAVVAVVTVAVAGTLGNQLPQFPGRLTAVYAILPAAAAALGIRGLRRRLADSTARLSRAADDAKAATELALAAERTRIASELHDVVTHNVSVMIVQAGAARKIMASSPADAEDALLAVEATGREAMTELRNLLGLLSPAVDGTGEDTRSGPVPAAMRPQPRLAELDTLIRRVSAAGLPVELTVSGSPRPLRPGADLAAYRVVQEGLTNVLRHAGAATAAVAVDWGENLEITVGDDGHGGGDGRAEPGRGLLGLRERLALYGGDMVAGHRPEGGWRVRAVLPLPEPAHTGSDRMSGSYSIFSQPPGDAGRPLKVVIADDQALVRGGFRLILKAAGIDVVAEAADGAQAVAAVLAHQPDVVLMDVRMPVMDGIEAAKRILAAFPDSAAGLESPDETPAAGLRSASCCYPVDVPRIIILTTFDLDEYVYAALSAGASGFLLKDVTPEHLVAAIQLVRTGDALLAPSITRRLVERFAPARDTAGPGRPARPGRAAGTGPAGEAAAALTPRELEVLGLVARGLSNAEIASELILSEATVKTHVARILTKLALRDRVQAVVLAYETGLISPGS